jgi:hypothetical protein
MPVPKFLQFLMGGDKGIIDSISEVVDKFTYSKEEKFQSQEEAKRATEEAEYRLKTLEQKSFQESLDAYTKLESIEVEDRKFARQRETDIAKAAPEKLWGLTVNITAILAFVVLGMSFTFHLLKGLGKINNSVELHMYDNITIMVIAYFFGTSIGSKNKEKILENINRNGTNT